MNHNIKIAPRYYDDVESGRKPFECRRNDRNYQVGDTLTLQEWLPGVEYTGREIMRVVTYVLPGGVFGIAEGYCVMGLADAWVPVTDRLPEVDKYGDVNVLVCMDDDFISSATYDKNNGWELWADAGEVTHWMYHPEPPKGE